MMERGVEAETTSAACFVRSHHTKARFRYARAPVYWGGKILQLLLMTFKNEQLLIVYGFRTVIWVQNQNSYG